MFWISSPLPNRPTEPEVLTPKQQLLKGCHPDHFSDPLAEFQAYIKTKLVSALDGYGINPHEFLHLPE
jgi:hypothetical protein